MRRKRTGPPPSELTHALSLPRSDRFAPGPPKVRMKRARFACCGSRTRVGLHNALRSAQHPKELCPATRLDAWIKDAHVG